MAVQHLLAMVGGERLSMTLLFKLLRDQWLLNTFYLHRANVEFLHVPRIIIVRLCYSSILSQARSICL